MFIVYYENVQYNLDNGSAHARNKARKGRKRMIKLLSKQRLETTCTISDKHSFLYRLKRDLKKNYILYLMLIPVLAYYIIFHYAPMYGVTLAFKDFNPKLGILGSPWIGFSNFERFFSGYNFWSLIRNTLGISLYSLVIGFPIPIIFALLLNSLISGKIKKTLQMVSYAPHFISMVAMCGILSIFLHPDTGIINILLEKIGFEAVAFLSEPKWFKTIYVFSGVWQNMGWDSVIYIAALAGVDYGMHEAAMLDGATKLQRIWHIDIPTILPTIVMLFILRVGSVMSVGFEKVFLLQNALNMEASDVLSTYVYRAGMLNNDYGFSTAIGLFNSAINILLLIIFNKLAKKITQNSLW